MTQNSRTQQEQRETIIPAFWNDSVWVHGILPFVGIGHFVFVAGVSRQTKEYYKAYCDTVNQPPMVKHSTDFGGGILPATKVDTFYSAAFSNIACAEYFLRQVKNSAAYGTKTCEMIAKTGNLEVLRWAHSNKIPWDEATTFAAAEKGHFSIF
jgi:hypothetical protein